MRWPSGENATDLIKDVSPVNGHASVSPAVELHTRLVRSSELETTRWPSGENATDQAESASLGNGPTVSLVAFHTRIVRSSELETTCWPSGEKLRMLQR